jgi:hypothetical protein
VCGGIPTTVRHQQLPRSLYHRQPPTSSITSVCPAASSTQSQQSAVKQTTHNSLHHQQPAISSIMTDYPAASTTATHSQQHHNRLPYSPRHRTSSSPTNQQAQPTTKTPTTTAETTEDLAFAPGAWRVYQSLSMHPSHSTGQLSARRVHEAADWVSTYPCQRPGGEVPRTMEGVCYCC